MYLKPELNAAERSAAVWENVDMQTGVDKVVQSRAAVELKHRLQDWHGDYLPRPSRFKNKHGIDRGNHLVVPADPIELVIVRAVSMTTGAAQFGVSPNGSIFTAHGDGWTIRGPRVDVTRLSWLLDEAADIVQDVRHGRGGRFYERNGRFFLADGRTTILEVVNEPDPTEQVREVPQPRASRPWWDRLIDSIFGQDAPESAAPARAPKGPHLPEDVRRARQAPVLRRAEEPWLDADPAGRQSEICPVHFIVLDHGARCDYCRTD